MGVKLERMDWERVKQVSEEQIRGAKLTLISANQMLENAVTALKAFPNPKPKKNSAVQ